jgi:ABC-type lipoprotein release transport system permease subunit
MGLTAIKIANIFAWQSIFIAAVGGFIGLLIGLIICLAQQYFGFIKISPNSPIAYPIVFEFGDAIIVLITIIILGIFTAIYPWNKARKIAMKLN